MVPDLRQNLSSHPQGPVRTGPDRPFSGPKSVLTPCPAADVERSPDGEYVAPLTTVDSTLITWRPRGASDRTPPPDVSRGLPDPTLYLPRRTVTVPRRLLPDPP